MKTKTAKLLCKTCKTADRPLVYALRGKDGDMLIDTGHLICVHSVDRWVKNIGLDLRYVFLTHGHFDHTANAVFFKKKYGAKLIMHELDIPLYKRERLPVMIGTNSSNERAAKIANKIILTKASIVPTCDIDIPITDNDTDMLRKLGFDADIVMLPGHSPGSMGILQGKVLYAGDACSAKGGDYFTAMFGEDVGKLLESEKKIFELNPLIIAPGHGRFIVNERAFPYPEIL